MIGTSLKPPSSLQRHCRTQEVSRDLMTIYTALLNTNNVGVLPDTYAYEHAVRLLTCQW